MSIHSYADAEAFLVNEHTKKPVPRKKVANNTYVVRGGHITGRNDTIEEHEIGIVLHETPVVVYGRDDTGEYVRFDTGGWYTVTTKARINKFAPTNLHLTSSKKRWLVIWAPDAEGNMWDGPSVPFVEGEPFRLDSASTLYVPENIPDTSREDAHNDMVRKLVTTYLHAVNQGVGEGGVMRSFAGCTLCRWDDIPGKAHHYSTTATIPSVGDKMGDTQHLLDHMLERVLPNEMELHAVREMAGDMERATIWQSEGWRVKEALRTFLYNRLMRGAAAANRSGRRPVEV